MTNYAVVETVLVVLIGVASAWQVMRVLMPRATQRMRAVISKRPQADGLPATGGGCAAGCSSGCNGCGAAAGIDQSLSAHRKPSR